MYAKLVSLSNCAKPFDVPPCIRICEIYYFPFSSCHRDGLLLVPLLVPPLHLSQLPVKGTSAGFSLTSYGRHKYAMTKSSKKIDTKLLCFPSSQFCSIRHSLLMNLSVRCDACLAAVKSLQSFVPSHQPGLSRLSFTQNQARSGVELQGLSTYPNSVSALPAACDDTV